MDPGSALSNNNQGVPLTFKLRPEDGKVQAIQSSERKQALGRRDN